MQRGVVVVGGVLTYGGLLHCWHGTSAATCHMTPGRTRCDRHAWLARGEVAVNPQLLTTILHQWRRLRARPVPVGSHRRPALTRRELDILAAMSEGLAAKAIATRLGVAPKTVENHKIQHFEKLGVRSHAHAVTVALAYGLTAAGPLSAPDGIDDR